MAFLDNPSASMQAIPPHDILNGHIKNALMFVFLLPIYKKVGITVLSSILQLIPLYLTRQTRGPLHFGPEPFGSQCFCAAVNWVSWLSCVAFRPTFCFLYVLLKLPPIHFPTGRWIFKPHKLPLTALLLAMIFFTLKRDRRLMCYYCVITMTSSSF